MKKLFLSIVALCAVTLVSAQDVVTLTVNGQGATKDVATANALRSAIEQAFGVFVSANTQILNDNLVKDEIATVSSGNIQQYSEIACVNMPNGEVYVTLSATVAIGKLVAYAKSKGSTAEFAGQTFAMNMKMLELNKRNEAKALEHMLSQLTRMAPNVFDWKLQVGDPKVSGDKYKIPMQVLAISNESSDAFYRTLIGTLSSLSLSEKEILQYQQVGMATYSFEIRSYDNLHYAWRRSTAALSYEPQKVWKFILRSDYQALLSKLSCIVRSLSSSFAISEIGQSSQLYEFRDKNSIYCYCLAKCTLNNPIAFNEEPGLGPYVESEGLAIHNFHKFIIDKTQKKKQSQPIIHQNNVYTHSVEVEIDQNRIASILGFDIMQKTASLAEYLYTIVSPWNANGLAVVIKDRHNWGIVNRDGDAIVALRCVSISQTQNGFVVTNLDGTISELDSMGQLVSK